MTGVMVQTQLKMKPRRILLKLNSKEMKWTPGHVYALLCCVLPRPRETKLAAYKISTSTLRKHVEVRYIITSLHWLFKMKLWRCFSWNQNIRNYHKQMPCNKTIKLIWRRDLQREQTTPPWPKLSPCSFTTPFLPLTLSPKSKNIHIPRVISCESVVLLHVWYHFKGLSVIGKMVSISQ